MALDEQPLRASKLAEQRAAVEALYGSTEIEQLRQEMMAWLEGRLSHVNAMMELYPPDRRVEALAYIAIMDAQEVVMRAAAIQALVAEVSMRKAVT